MQLAEQEIILPLNTKSGIRNNLKLISFLEVFVLAGNGWNVVQLARQEGGQVDLILLILWALFLLGYSWFVIWSIWKLRAPAPTLRVSHEGIFFSVLIRWDEIWAIFPYTPPGAGLVVGIDVKDYDALIARYAQDKSAGSMRFVGRTNAWLLRLFRYRAQVNIPQHLLSLSIHEFMAEIRARFAAELDEHHITIREWQY